MAKRLEELRNCIDAKNSPPIILRVSGGNSIIGDDLSHEAITTSLKEAIRLNVSAVAISIYVGAKYEHQTLINLAGLEHLIDARRLSDVLSEKELNPMVCTPQI